MYCRKCYTRLDPGVWDANPPPSPGQQAYFKKFATRCEKCGRVFDPANAKTYLAQPFPDRSKIVLHVIATSLVCIGVAFVVSFFQMAAASGH